MAKILFVPCNGLQVGRFALVIPYFPAGTSVFCVSNEKFLRMGVEKAFSSCSLDYIRLESLDSAGCGKIIDRIGADLLVIGNDSNYISYLFIIEAKKRSIPSLLMQDGAIARLSKAPRGISISGFSDISDLFRRYSIQYIAKRFEMRLKSKFLKVDSPIIDNIGYYTTDIAVWGDFSKKSFVERGVFSEKIHITGNPSFDRLAEARGRMKGRKPSGKKIIIFALSDMVGSRLWSRAELEFAVKTIVECCVKMKDVALVLRPHPYEDSSLYGQIAKKYPGVEVSSGGDLHALLADSDAVLTEVSTVAFEAILLGKPVGIVNFTKSNVSYIYPGAYITAGAAVEISNAGECGKTINALLYDKKLKASLQQGAKRFENEQIFRLDGKASKRVADLMVTLLSERRQHGLSDKFVGVLK